MTDFDWDGAVAVYGRLIDRDERARLTVGETTITYRADGLALARRVEDSERRATFAELADDLADATDHAIVATSTR